jgi:hypothetical protein
LDGAVNQRTSELTIIEDDGNAKALCSADSKKHGIHAAPKTGKFVIQL